MTSSTARLLERYGHDGALEFYVALSQGLVETYALGRLRGLFELKTKCCPAYKNDAGCLHLRYPLSFEIEAPLAIADSAMVFLPDSVRTLKLSSRRTLCAGDTLLLDYMILHDVPIHAVVTPQ